MISKMTLSLSQKLNKDEEAEEVETETPTDLDPFFEEQPIHEGDQFMACKPWTGAIKEPTEDSGPIINEASPPDESYAFDFVHGYKSDECY
jgi:microtubule-associated protein-like 6